MKKTVALLIGALAVSGLVLEGGGRLAMRSRAQRLFVSPYLQHLVNQYDPELMWSLKPNLKNETAHIASGGESVKCTVSTNELGLRHGELASGNPFRILALGDSTTFGVGVDDGDTWPAQLQAILDPEGTGRYEVLNAGVPGYSAYQGLRYLELRGLDLKPMIVIVNFGHNDCCSIQTTGLRDTEWENPAGSSGFASLLKTALRGASVARGTSLYGARKRLTPGEFLDTLVKMGDVCMSKEIMVVFLVWPFREDLRRGTMALPMTLIERVAESPQHRLIDLTDVLEGVVEEVYVDGVHANSEGNRIVAEYIARDLKRQLPRSFGGGDV